MAELLFLSPIFKEMIWGGNRLKSEFHYDIPSENTGECWAISAHENGDCVIKSGSFSGKKLSELWTSNPELFGDVDKGDFPLLIKIIDAKQDLSILNTPEFINDHVSKLAQKEKFSRNIFKYHGKKTLVLDLDETFVMASG